MFQLFSWKTSQQYIKAYGWISVFVSTKPSIHRGNPLVLQTFMQTHWADVLYRSNMLCLASVCVCMCERVLFCCHLRVRWQCIPIECNTWFVVSSVGLENDDVMSQRCSIPVLVHGIYLYWMGRWTYYDNTLTRKNFVTDSLRIIYTDRVVYACIDDAFVVDDDDAIYFCHHFLFRLFLFI